MPVSASSNKPRPLSYFWLSLALAVIFVSGSCLHAFPGAYASESNLDVNQIDISLYHGNYVFSANVEYRVTDTARDALQKGIPLFWDVVIKLVQRREWLWNRTLTNIRIRYRIQYQALLNRYRVTNISTGESDSFATLSAALARMTVIRNLIVSDRNAIKPGDSYQIGIKIKFDREALPLPLRPISYVNPEWYLSSDWYIWPVQQ